MYLVPAVTGAPPCLRFPLNATACPVSGRAVTPTGAENVVPPPSNPSLSASVTETDD